MRSEPPTSITESLDDPSLTEGQRRRIRLFAEVEEIVAARVEQLCGEGGLDVRDVAALIVDPAANELVFGGDLGGGPTALIGHRLRVYAILDAALPRTPDAPFDPYADLLTPAPDRCVRVLVLDRASLTVMCYGTFVTVDVDRGKRGAA